MVDREERGKCGDAMECEKSRGEGREEPSSRRGQASGVMQ